MNIDLFHAYFLDTVKPIIDRIAKANASSLLAQESRETTPTSFYGEYARDSRFNCIRQT